MTIKYEAVCSSCKRAFPVMLTDPSKAPICCGKKMDTFPVDVKEQRDEIIESLGFYETS